MRDSICVEDGGRSLTKEFLHPLLSPPAILRATKSIRETVVRNIGCERTAGGLLCGRQDLKADSTIRVIFGEWWRKLLGEASLLFPSFSLCHSPR